MLPDTNLSKVADIEMALFMLGVEENIGRNLPSKVMNNLKLLDTEHLTFPPTMHLSIQQRAILTVMPVYHHSAIPKLSA